MSENLRPVEEIEKELFKVKSELKNFACDSENIDSFKKLSRSVFDLRKELDHAVFMSGQIEIKTYFEKNKMLMMIEDLLSDAFDGGASAYWAEMIHAGNKVDMKTESLYFIKRELTIGEIEPSQEGDKILSKKLDEKNLLIGLKVMAEKCPRHFYNLISENADGETADVFLQCAVLGEIIYG